MRERERERQRERERGILIDVKRKRGLDRDVSTLKKSENVALR